MKPSNRSQSEATEMRLVPRHRRRQRGNVAPRIEISQAEITADLTYRGEVRLPSPAPAAAPVRGRR
jgi:hypothetical protein